ncbi:MAG: EpsG family protein [Chitinophagaceae bacterium]|nr:EpsG family protein [Chitinophagaceae bacterium]
MFYGFTFAIGKESLIANNESDIVRYVSELKELYGKDLSFDDAIKVFTESGEADILRTFLAIVISRFSNSQQVLTAVYGFIFGFFFSRNIWYVIERLNGKLKGMTILLLLVFFLVNPFWNINGFRFNTAVHIFIYGLLPFLYEGKKKGILIAASAVLVHFSFLLPVSLLLIYVVLGNRMNIYFGLFVLSIFISNIDIGEFNSFIEANVPEVFVERSKGYRDEEKVNDFRREDDGKDAISNFDEGGIVQNWYVVYYFGALYNSEMLILVALYFLGRRFILTNKWLLNGYCFTLLIFAIANIMSSLPSGSRFLMLASLSALAVIIFYVQNQEKEKYIYRVLLFTIPFLLLYVIVLLRTGLYSVSVNTIVGNPILSLITDYNLSLNDLIK